MALNGERHVLVVAGSDSSGGAGIARDIETIAGRGVKTCLAVTAITVQTHHAVRQVVPADAMLVEAQMRSALEANDVAAVKIGMLGTEEIIAAVASVLERHEHIPMVLDPVLAASSGGRLLGESAVGTLKTKLLRHCAVLTPNLGELGTLTGKPPARDETEALDQAQALLSLMRQGGAILVKGGHGHGPWSTDILVRDGELPERFEARRLAVEMRGTGCMLASGIAAYLAKGETLCDSVAKAKALLHDKLSAQAERNGLSVALSPPA